MDQAWEVGQTLANAGARAARVGGQVGLALGQHALDNPLLTAGFGGFAAGNYQAYQAVQRNDVPAYAGAAAMTLMGTGMILAAAIRSMLQGNPARLQVDAEMMGEAANMLTGFHDDVDMSTETDRHTLNVANHLQDIASLPADRLHPAVRNAAETANNDPQQLIRNLLAVVKADPPVLSSRSN
ncbi:hypothetical protein [Ralstonia solanacearum]|uniref:hypothetical protein n=1 Tax=Ralstonia solanacearum TaxID=305 RepID=UPI000505D412|nr:hypothetical protein [Ralstonia solanacearum]KFX26622.1 hypothetical protein KR96_22830 [Ralstonia solanacearum]